MIYYMSSKTSQVKPVNEIDIMKAICILTNQYFLDNTTKQLSPIEVEKSYKQTEFGEKKRLFSDIKTNVNKGIVTIKKIDNKFPIKSIILNERATNSLEANTLVIISEPVEFRKTILQGSENVTIISMIKQTVYYNLVNKSIKFVLSEDTKNFNYVSLYKFDEQSNTFKLDPYTEDSYKIIKPVKRVKTLLSKLTGPVVNIYSFINNHSKKSSSKVTINSTLLELQTSMDILNKNFNVVIKKTIKSIDENKMIAIFNFVNGV